MRITMHGDALLRSSPASSCPSRRPSRRRPSPDPTSIWSPARSGPPAIPSSPSRTSRRSRYRRSTRGTGTGGVTAVQRIVDRNTAVKFDDDPFFVDGINVLDVGTTGQFKDKPWNAADVPGRAWNTGTCVIPGYNNGVAVPAFNVYVSFTNFVGQSTGNPHPQILVSRSTDCGATF